MDDLNITYFQNEEDSDEAFAEEGYNDTIMESVHIFTGASTEEQIRVILPYSLIFLLAVVGNGLVILTLAANQRMRTVTNVFLLNLAISDLLLGVFCMPFTLAGTLLRRFVFGELMCRLIPYLQGVSVSVSAWTLVVISVERYYGICDPLHSREWQTLSHAYRRIAAVWVGSFICMLPVCLLSELQPIGDTGNYKCREAWPNEVLERVFAIFLDIVLLIIPLLVLSLTFGFIARTLWAGIQPRTARSSSGDSSQSHSHRSATYSPSTGQVKVASDGNRGDGETSPVTPPRRPQVTGVLRSSNQESALLQKKRVIKMLLVVVLEYFICWTPLYTINTLSLFSPKAIYHGLGYFNLSLFLLLAYISACCNPITYCFMNAKFRKSFLALARCQRGGTERVSATFRSTLNSTKDMEANRCHKTSTPVI